MEDPLEATLIDPESNHMCKNSKYVKSPFVHTNGCIKNPFEDVNVNGLIKPTLQINHVMPYNDSNTDESPSEKSFVDVDQDQHHRNEISSQIDIDNLSKSLENTSMLQAESFNDDSLSNCSVDIINEIETPCSTQAPISYVVYESELQMPDIMRLITKDLSEPYSIYTYRYFIHNWPKLCFLAMDQSNCVGAIVCKLDLHKKMARRGYIAMLATDENYRRRGIGTHLVMKAIRAMVDDDCDEVVLETEITNKAALRLYENLGFVRDKRLFRYYLNGVDAFRLKLWLR